MTTIFQKSPYIGEDDKPIPMDQEYGFRCDLCGDFLEDDSDVLLKHAIDEHKVTKNLLSVLPDEFRN